MKFPVMKFALGEDSLYLAGSYQLSQLNLAGSFTSGSTKNLPEQNCPGIITFGRLSGMFIVG